MSTVQDFDFSVDILRALLWQHNKAEHLEQLLRSKQTWYDANQQQFWSDWVRDVFDLRTANAFGLSVWSIILGMPLTVQTGASVEAKPRWGFGAFKKNFGHGNFTNNSSSTVALSVDQARLVLRLRYYQLVSRCTVVDLNRFLKYLFKDKGDVHVLDFNDMSVITYVFNFVPDSQFAFILENYDILPRPATVGVNYIVLPPDKFGFDIYNENLRDSNFAL